MKKKAQITVFIIIGILLLITVSTVFYLKNSKKEVAVVEEKYPEQLLPVKNYVTQCMEYISEDAIRKIGKNGGFIGFSEEDKKYTKTELLFAENEPTESDGIVFMPGVDWKIPYWNYFKSGNGCKEGCTCGSKQPPLYKNTGLGNSIEEQISRYVELNIKDCLKFENLKEYDKVSVGTPKAQTFIKDNEVTVALELSVNADKGTQKYSAKTFSVNMPVRLKAMYEFADYLVTAEKNYSYFEKQTMDVISSFTGKDKNMLPPISDSELAPEKPAARWMKNDVRKKVDELIAIYTPLLSVYGTYGFAPRYNRYALFILPNPTPDPELSVSFSYLPQWKSYFNIHGRGVKGDSIGPESFGSKLFSFIGVKRYTFYYDVSYPVLVRLHDATSFNNQGYDFYFAMESNVRGNKPLECSGPEKPLAQVPFAGTFYCDEKQKCADVKISTIDAFSGKQIENPQIMYSCVQTSCELDYNSETGSFKAPQCINGVLSISGENYFSTEVSKTFLCGEQYDEKIEVTPKTELNVSVMKKQMVKLNGNWSLGSSQEGLYENEKVVISLERVKENDYESDFSAETAVLKGKTQSIELMPGTYRVEILLLYDLPDKFGNEEFVIPETVKEEKGPLGMNTQYTLPEVRLNGSVMSGQVILDNTTGYFVLDKDKLKGKTKITFYTLSLSQLDQLTHEDLDVFAKFDQYSAENRDELEPQLS